MVDIRGFLKYDRQLPTKREVDVRINDYNEIYTPFPEEELKKQTARCMDCGTPFCHSGCPLGNIIPDFNDAAHSKDWKRAFEILSSTNNFPEFTGRICPAPCEAACVLGINSDPVTIELIEKNIVEKAFELGWIKPFVPQKRSGKKIAIVGSGPAGLAAADQLNKVGHTVTVYERSDRIGGLLRYGIPDFKLEKWVIDRRLEVMKQSGIEFITGAEVGKDITLIELQDLNDAVLLAGGSTIPRDLPIEGRNLSGIHYAMEYLEQKNRQVAGDTVFKKPIINAAGKNVLVIGGGDTGSDCVGTANREKAKSITQIELLGKPPQKRNIDSPWPLWPMILRTSTSHEEGCEREWSVYTKAFIANENGHVEAIQAVEIEWNINPVTGKAEFIEIPETLRSIDCDLVLIAAGFVHPQLKGMIENSNLKLDSRGNVWSEKYATNMKGVFTAGDMNRGQSLVVWAIAEGREASVEIDKYLNGGISSLEKRDVSDLMI